MKELNEETKRPRVESHRRVLSYVFSLPKQQQQHTKQNLKSTDLDKEKIGVRFIIINPYIPEDLVLSDKGSVELP